MLQSILRCALSAALILTASGCLKISGQRLAWRHDAQTDTLSAVIFYDGIFDHEIQNDQEIERAAKRLSQFIDSGNIMLLDWWGELDIGDKRKATDQDLEKPGAAELFAVIDLVKTQPIGHFMQADRIGAAQYVQIRNVSRFIGGINRCINAQILADKSADQGERPEVRRTDELRKKLAAEGHEWIRLDGQAIVIRLPFDPDHWARLKADVLAKFIEDMIKLPPQPSEPGDVESWYAARAIAQIISATVWSIDDRDQIITITLGQRDRPNGLRTTVREGYNPQLAKSVMQLVPQRLNDKLVAALIDGKAEDAVQAVIDFGPPEAVMLALADAAALGNEKAVQLLRDRARQWNQAGRFPAILNVESENPVNLVNAVRDWSVQMMRYPLEKEQLAVPQLPPAPDQ